ncbi:MAG: hypothetical protein EXR72_20955 [Myxococcales bacterium]|nr:hypothetical protein [Myxococcales bacterium]
MSPRAAWLPALTLLAVGCAGSRVGTRSEAPAATVEDARAQIARLQGRIGARRAELGLDPQTASEEPAKEAPRPAFAAPAGPPPAPGGSPAGGAAPVDWPRIETEQKTPAADRPERAGEDSVSLPVPVITAAPNAPARLRERDFPRAARPSSRCRRVTEAADEICEASRRICVLADQISDGDARRSCEGAGDDCRRARHVAAGCR